jgi:hypothetical protein
MPDSKTRSVWLSRFSRFGWNTGPGGRAGLAATALGPIYALLACATGTGSPTAFSTENQGAADDAAFADKAAAFSRADASLDQSYDPAAPSSCDASLEDALADADDAAPADADDASVGDADDGGAGGDDGGGAAVTPSVGELIITEIMFDPSGSVPEAQWFEVYNLTAAPELLSGLTIQDGWGDAQMIASAPPVIVPPFAYVLLVRDAATAVSSAVPSVSIVYEYGTGLSSDQGIELAWDSTGDLSLWNGAVELVDVPYGPWNVAFLGQSIELGPLQAAGADQAANWCVAQSPWSSGSDDGTPGLPNDCP